MKTLAILVVGLLLALGGAAIAQSPQQLLNEAQRAYLIGNIDLAKEKFQLVLLIQPDNLTATNYLRMINASTKKGGAGDLEKQLKLIVLTKVEFKDASFGSALDYLKQQVTKESQGKTVVSFVVDPSAAFAQAKTVSLNLGSIPFIEALRYLCTLAEVDFRIEKYAVIIVKKQPTGASAGS